MESATSFQLDGVRLATTCNLRLTVINLKGVAVCCKTVAIYIRYVLLYQSQRWPHTGQPCRIHTSGVTLGQQMYKFINKQT